MMPKLTPRSENVRCFLRAQILYNNRTATINCLIRHISHEGARIDIDKAHPIPTEFEIHIPHKNQTQNARMIWRDDNAIGIEFLTADTKSSADGVPPGSEGLRLIALQMQNAELKTRIRELSKRLEDLGQDPKLDIDQVI